MNQFEEKLNKWFAIFSEMQPGQTMEVAKVGKRDPQLFIDVCKEFIDQGNSNYEFTNDYRFFRRMNIY